MCLEGTTEGWMGVDDTDGGGETVHVSGPATEKARLPNFRSFIASIVQYLERSFFYYSASDLPVRRIRSCSVAFGVTQTWTWVGSIHGLDWVYLRTV